MLAALEMPDLTIAVGFYVVFLLSVTAHEASHALAALKLGDRTAYLGGQVTLDPMPHIRREPIGMVLLPILTLLTIGWPLGFAHAPYDPVWAARYPRRAAWMALAGPAANLVLAGIAFGGMKAGLSSGAFTEPSPAAAGFASLVMGDPGLAQAFAMLCSLLFIQNLVLLVFNLLPFPPMDGAAALPLVLPESGMRAVRRWFSEPWIPLLGLIVAWNLFPRIFYPIFQHALGLLYP